MQNVRKHLRLLAFGLLAIMLLGDISSAAMGGFGGHGMRGRFGHSARFFNSSFGMPYSNFQGIPIIMGDYQSNDYYTYHSRYDNFPYTTDSRYDNSPNPAQSRYNTQPPQGNTYSNNNNTYTYTYNTYNYYGGDEGSAAKYGSSAYQRPTQQKSEVGIYYENGVTAFKNGDYAAAAKNFQNAIRQANKFMPLAYTQALFANGNYAPAAEQLRLAINKLSPENDKILFPSFLYPGNTVLLSQIETLRKNADTNSDFQLLVGYQLFGVKKFADAAAFLNKAKSNPINEPAATKLLLMMKKAVTNGPLTPAY